MIVLEPGKKLYANHVDKYSSEYNKSVGMVIVNKNNPSLWGIRLALLRDVEVQDGMGNVKTIAGTGVVPIVKNLKITFNEQTTGGIK